MTDGRPDPTAVTTGEELRRWYWLKSELVTIARQLGVSPAGGKQVLTERLAATLDGTTPPAPVVPRVVGTQLSGPLTSATVIPPGQRCSQPVRAFLAASIGPKFRFDGAMRAFFAAADGTSTLADAVAHWHHTRDRPPPEIGSQFELNRFTRTWWRDHPAGGRAELAQAWQHYRAAPTHQRARV